MSLRFLEENILIYCTYVLMLGLIASIMLYASYVLLVTAEFMLGIIIFISRFLSGFGFLSLVFMGLLLVFRYVPKNYRKRKSILMAVRLLLVLVLMISILLPLLSLLQVFLGVANYSRLSITIGVLSFVVTMYLVPLWREKELPGNRGIAERIKEQFGRISRKIKKGYYYYFSRDYLRAFSIDFIYLKTQIDAKRISLGRLFFPLIILAMLYCPPALIVGIIYILRLRKNILGIIDNVAISVALIASLMFPLIMFPIPNYFILVWNTAYFLGSVTVAIMFGPAVIDLICG